MNIIGYCYFLVLLNLVVGNAYEEDCPYHGGPYTYGRGSYMCGNVCTSEYDPCICGNATLSYQQLRHQCCVPPDEVCYVVYNIDFDGELKFMKNKFALLTSTCLTWTQCGH